MEKRELGKIVFAEFGFEEDYSFGLRLGFKNNDDGWGVNTRTSYNPLYKGLDKNSYRLEMIEEVEKILKDAKVQYVSELKNIPVELIFKDSLLVNFRILTEVL